MITAERRNGIEVITLDRPEKGNALHPDLVLRLSRRLERLDRTDEARVVVITGAGPNFCAGLDLGHLIALDGDGSVEYMGSAFALFRQIYGLRQPVIAAVNGPAMAGGFDLAAFCDIRLCSSNATFAQTEIRLGLTQIMFPVYEIIGLSRARELALTGDPISAEEAYRIGLVSAVHPPDDLLPQALRLAERLARQPPEALFATKRLGRELLELDPDAALQHMLDVITVRLRSQEYRDALAAYVETLDRRSRTDPPTP